MGRRGHRRGRGPYALRSRLARARLDYLVEDPRLRQAARIARAFRLDPVTVLEESDVLKGEVRVAAYLVCQHDEEQAAKPRPGMTAGDVAGLPEE